MLISSLTWFKVSRRQGRWNPSPWRPQPKPLRGNLLISAVQNDADLRHSGVMAVRSGLLLTARLRRCAHMKLRQHLRQKSNPKALPGTAPIVHLTLLGKKSAQWGIIWTPKVRRKCMGQWCLLKYEGKG